MFLLLWAGSKKHPRGSLGRASSTRIFKRQLQTLGEQEMIILLTFTCLHWVSPRDIITLVPRPPQHTACLSTKTQTRNESMAGGVSWAEMTCPLAHLLSLESVDGALFIFVFSAPGGGQSWWRFPGVLLGEEVCCGVGNVL